MTCLEEGWYDGISVYENMGTGIREHEAQGGGCHHLHDGVEVQL